jgi:hypothetical protein
LPEGSSTVYFFHAPPAGTTLSQTVKSGDPIFDRLSMTNRRLYKYIGKFISFWAMIDWPPAIEKALN